MAQFVCACVIACLVVVALAAPAQDDGGYADKNYNRELINLLTAMRYPDQYYNDDRFQNRDGIWNKRFSWPKRNSELINSLLSLPKNMNDAGK